MQFFVATTNAGIHSKNEITLLSLDAINSLAPYSLAINSPLNSTSTRSAPPPPPANTTNALEQHRSSPRHGTGEELNKKSPACLPQFLLAAIGIPNNSYDQQLAAIHNRRLSRIPLSFPQPITTGSRSAASPLLSLIPSRIKQHDAKHFSHPNLPCF